MIEVGDILEGHAGNDFVVVSRSDSGSSATVLWVDQESGKVTGASTVPIIRLRRKKKMGTSKINVRLFYPQIQMESDVP